MVFVVAGDGLGSWFASETSGHLQRQRRMGVRGGDANRWVKTLGVRAPEKKGL